MLLCHSMNADWVVGTLKGGGGTQTLPGVIKHFALRGGLGGTLKHLPYTAYTHHALTVLVVKLSLPNILRYWLINSMWKEHVLEIVLDICLKFLIRAAGQAKGCLVISTCCDDLKCSFQKKKSCCVVSVWKDSVQQGKTPDSAPIWMIHGMRK